MACGGTKHLPEGSTSHWLYNWGDESFLFGVQDIPVTSLHLWFAYDFTNHIKHAGQFALRFDIQVSVSYPRTGCSPPDSCTPFQECPGFLQSDEAFWEQQMKPLQCLLHLAGSSAYLNKLQSESCTLISLVYTENKSDKIAPCGTPVFAKVSSALSEDGQTRNPYSTNSLLDLKAFAGGHMFHVMKGWSKINK